MNPHSLTIADETKRLWLSYQINGFPDEPIEIESGYPGIFGSHKMTVGSRHRTLVGSFGNHFPEAGDTFEKMREPDPWFPSSFENAGELFGLEKEWWKTDEPFDTWLCEVAASCFYDAWLYYNWLLSREGGRETASRYRAFFAASVSHPEWRQALQSSKFHCYPPPGSNLGVMLPNIWEFLDDPERRRNVWHSGISKRPGGDRDRFAYDSYRFLRSVATAQKDTKKRLLSEGVNFISFAALHNDDLFFEALGKCLNTEYRSEPRPSLVELADLPRRGIASKKAWIRRLWLSRGFWLFDPLLLQQDPISLSKSQCRELSGNPYSKAKTAHRNDGLYRAGEPWFTDAFDSGGQTCLRLTKTAPLSLSDGAGNGFPLEIVCKDLE